MSKHVESERMCKVAKVLLIANLCFWIYFAISVRRSFHPRLHPHCTIRIQSLKPSICTLVFRANVHVQANVNPPRKRWVRCPASIFAPRSGGA